MDKPIIAIGKKNALMIDVEGNVYLSKFRTFGINNSLDPQPAKVFLRLPKCEWCAYHKTTKNSEYFFVLTYKNECLSLRFPDSSSESLASKPYFVNMSGCCVYGDHLYGVPKQTGRDVLKREISTNIGGLVGKRPNFNVKQMVVGNGGYAYVLSNDGKVYVYNNGWQPIRFEGGHGFKCDSMVVGNDAIILVTRKRAGHNGIILSTGDKLPADHKCTILKEPPFLPYYIYQRTPFIANRLRGGQEGLSCQFASFKIANSYIQEGWVDKDGAFYLSGKGQSQIFKVDFSRCDIKPKVKYAFARGNYNFLVDHKGKVFTYTCPTDTTLLPTADRPYFWNGFLNEVKNVNLYPSEAKQRQYDIERTFIHSSN